MILDVSAGPEQTEPAAPAPPTPPTQQQPAEPVGPSMAAFGGNDSCPNCGARMAADQRYCLNCGHRRGDPRLPFMDAVVFMESMSAPPGGGGTPPPPPASSSGGSSPRMNANAALIAGVATLVLALGVGFLIGRGSNDNSNNAAAEAPIKVIEVGGGGGGGGEAETTGTEESTESSKESSKNKKGGGNNSAIKAEGNKATKKAEKGASEGAHGQSEAVENVLHTEEGVELETEVEVGGSCKEGTAGCEHGKFEGNFFGE